MRWLARSAERVWVENDISAAGPHPGIPVPVSSGGACRTTPDWRRTEDVLGTMRRASLGVLEDVLDR